jgi:hypothetical protein
MGNWFAPIFLVNNLLLLNQYPDIDADIGQQPKYLACNVACALLTPLAISIFIG